MRRSFRFAMVVTTAVLMLEPISAQSGRKKPRPDRPSAVAELTVSDEIAMPGTITQIKIYLTEPKPISTGFFDVDGGFGDIAGVAVSSPDGDATALAWSDGGAVRVVAGSLSATFGTGDSDYPLMTLAVRVPASLPMGTVIPIALDPASLDLRDPRGNPYVVIAAAGSITVGRVPSVEDVVPGSAVVDAGGTVTVFGHDFVPDMRVQLAEADVLETTIVSASELRLVLASPLDMHGRRVRLRTRASRTSYFSYQRTTDAAPSAWVTLRDIDPAYSSRGARLGAVLYPAPVEGRLQALALQNALLTPVTVQLERLGTPGAASIDLPAASRVVLEMSEIFGSSCDASCAVLYSATEPVQGLGFTTDLARTSVRLMPSR